MSGFFGSLGPRGGAMGLTESLMRKAAPKTAVVLLAAVFTITLSATQTSQQLAKRS
jgi:hypothetical protein